MRIATPRAIAFLISAIAIAITGLLGLYVYSAGQELNSLATLGAFIVAFLVVFFSAQYFITRFIFEKINPIYKTIQSLNVPDKRHKRSFENKDIISEVNREVIEWADIKSKEIDRLKELESYRKEFLGNVSHELKTPIFNIQGYILTLLDGALNDPTINKKYLERTEKSINRLISIVEDLESISKLESKVLKLVMEKIDIVQLVTEVFDSQEIRARNRGITLAFEEEYDDPIWVVADRKRVFQALTNLVANSINYGKEGGRTKVSIMDMNENILIEVNDNGIGIAKQDIPRVFERFYRVDKSRSREQGGTGLGLAIVKHIIEAHNQSISVRSSLNEGTSFLFTLKRYKSEKTF